jgi:dipeptidyl-peptidase-4
MRISFLLLALTLTCSASAQNKLITLEDIWRDNTFAVKSVPGFNAMKDGENYTELGGQGDQHTLTIKSLKDGSTGKVLYTGKLNIDEYELGSGLDRVLLLTESKNIYRRSILHKAYVYDVKSGTETLIDQGKVLHASFSPDGTKVAYVKDNNLYYQDLVSGTITPITTDGAVNKIINGNCDWVYEEEFGFTRAYEWAPDGKHIAYYRFDESQVPQYTMTVYDSLYPTPYQYKYPKAGEPNSTVSIHIYDLATKTTKSADLTGDDGTVDVYVPRIKWTTNPDQLCVYRLNRRQDKLTLYLADAASAMMQPIYEETNKAFIDVNDNLRFLPDGRSFLFNSERDGWNHLYIYDWKSKKLTPLTPGNYDIADLVQVDPSAKTVFYTAAEASPMERKLYAVSFNGKGKVCLTAEAGTHAITAIEGAKYFFDRYSSLNTPPVYLLRDAKGKVVRTLEDNKALKAKMAEYSLGKMSFMQLAGADGTTLNAWRILPPDFDPAKKYPVLLYQYSGPNSQEVADRFPVRDYFWHHMLAQKGYVVICADGTGTGFRGEAFRKKTYLQLGKYESDDQIAIAKYLATVPYIDPARIGIWGWSYGGFMSSTCILKGADIFKMAIAVAPVTNWRYYDNIYTERYMRKPAENKEGYDNNAPESMAANLKGKFLLIHGTGDDNVHFQNSVMLVNNLIKEGKDFDSEYYPNRAHGISGGPTRLHLYRRMTNFILANL